MQPSSRLGLPFLPNYIFAIMMSLGVALMLTPALAYLHQRFSLAKSVADEIARNRRATSLQR